jgi:hypothetical protein
LERLGTFESTTAIADGTKDRLGLGQDGCRYRLYVYPSHQFDDRYNTSLPIILTFAVAMVSLFTVLMLVFYDRLVETRRRIVLDKAAQSTAIVSSLFPKAVRNRLM